MNQLVESFRDDPQLLEVYYSDLMNEIDRLSYLNIFLHYDKADILKQIEELKKSPNTKTLYGLPVVVKDIISVKNQPLTCASKMLENFTAVYDATLIKRLKEAGAIIVGKVNMDEFAMGSSSETSFFGPTKNPIDPTLIPGGSSSGSAAAVKAKLCVVGIGTDTGGSSRQPASYCNVIGYLPTYGTISRYGVVSMANTLDTIGLLGTKVEDIVDVLNVVNGHDDLDMTSIKGKLNIHLNENYSSNNKILGIIDPEVYGCEPEVIKDYQTAIESLKQMGYEFKTVRFDYLKYANALYNVIMTSEVSSNMSRFDGIRYGFLDESYQRTKDLFVETRSKGFGEEVQRRIAMGTHYLASETDQAIYKQGLKIRRLIHDEWFQKLDEVDFIITPTTTNLPYKLGSRKEDPLAMYDSGIFNVVCNIAGLCAISMPIRDGISGSVQFIAKGYDDQNLLNMAYQFERRK